MIITKETPINIKHMNALRLPDITYINAWLLWKEKYGENADFLNPEKDQGVQVLHLKNSLRNLMLEPYKNKFGSFTEYIHEFNERRIKNAGVTFAALFNELTVIEWEKEQNILTITVTGDTKKQMCTCVRNCDENGKVTEERIYLKEEKEETKDSFYREKESMYFIKEKNNKIIQKHKREKKGDSYQTRNLLTNTIELVEKINKKTGDILSVEFPKHSKLFFDKIQNCPFMHVSLFQKEENELIPLGMFFYNKEKGMDILHLFAAFLQEEM